MSLWVPKTSSGAPTRDDVPERNVGTCRATYVPHSVAPAVRQDPDGDLEILASNPIGVFGTYRSNECTQIAARCTVVMPAVTCYLQQDLRL
jgi:hypothetical protein